MKYQKKTSKARKNNKGDILKATGNSSSAVFYSSTANPFIIKLRMKHVVQKTVDKINQQTPVLQQQVEQLKRLLLRLEQSMNKAQSESTGTPEARSGNVQTLVMIQRVRRKLQGTEKQLREVALSENDVRARFKQLRTFGKLGTLVMSNNLTGFAAKKYPVDPDQCNTCEMPYTFNPRSFLSTCKNCNSVVSFIFNQEEYTHEAIASKLYSDKSNIDEGGAVRNITFTNGSEAVVLQQDERQKSDAGIVGCGSKQAKGSVPSESSSKNAKSQSARNVLKNSCGLAAQVSNRSALFRRYLSQFLDDAPEVPLEVFHLLQSHLTHNHLHHTVRCKPTPVASILKNSDFKHLAYMAVKISRMHDGLDVPVISKDMLEDMVKRYNVVISMDIEKVHREKLYSFEFVSSLIFFALGRLDLCKMIQQNKNRCYFNFQDSTVQYIVAKASAANQELDWSRLTLLIPAVPLGENEQDVSLD